MHKILWFLARINYAIHDTLRISAFTSDVINETLWQCVPLQRDRMLELVNGVELPAAIALLMQGTIHWIWIGPFGSHLRPNNATTRCR